MTNGAECRNCGAALAGAYCSACGQAADVRIPSFGGMLADALGDLYSFDSRLWRSLATLALKPGRMTSLYLEGQRARFTPPFRMYVVTSLVFFVAFSLVRSMNPPSRQRSGGSGQRYRGGTVGRGDGAGAGCRYGGRGRRCSRHRRGW